MVLRNFKDCDILLSFFLHATFLLFSNFDADKGLVACRLHHVKVSAKNVESRNMVKIAIKGRHTKRRQVLK